MCIQQQLANQIPPPHVHSTIKQSSTNILIPPEARQPSEVPVLGEDPNIAGAIAGLIAPRHPRETTQHYEQRRAAGERLRGTPMPAFFGQAGDWSEKLMEHAAPLQLHPQTKSEKPDKIPLAEKLEDRVAYQRMRNKDLSVKGGS